MSASEVPDWPLGEYSDVQRSGVNAVLAAADANTAVLKHAERLQCAVNDLRTLCGNRHTIGTVEIRNLLESHHI